jgi:hypothetical protein
MVHLGSRIQRSPLLCTACVLATSEYTFTIAGQFLSYKIIARDFLGSRKSTGIMHLTLGSLRKSQAVFYALSFSQSDGFAAPAPAQVTQTVSPLVQNIGL